MNPAHKAKAVAASLIELRYLASYYAEVVFPAITDEQERERMKRDGLRHDLIDFMLADPTSTPEEFAALVTGNHEFLNEGRLHLNVESFETFKARVDRYIAMFRSETSIANHLR